MLTEMNTQTMTDLDDDDVRAFQDALRGDVISPADPRYGRIAQRTQ